MQRIIILCVILMSMDTTKACNICSCTGMGNSLGILPRFQSHFIGIRQTGRTYQSSHPASILNPEGSVSNEKYFNSEIWGRWYPHQKLQIFAFLPYNVFIRKQKSGEKSLKGFGDISLQANYLLLNTGDSSKSLIKHALLIGGGVKLPTGTFDKSEYPVFQLGTGSTDILLNGAYTVRFKSLGLMSEGNYRFNGSNSNQYTFGKRLGIAAKAFYWYGKNENSVLPYAGLNYEQTEKDRLNGRAQDYTGSKTAYLVFGTDLYRNQVQVGFNIQIPYMQNMGDGQIREYTRWQFSLVYHLKKREQCK